MPRFSLPCLLLLLLSPSFGLADSEALRRYIDRPDASFGFVKEATLESGSTAIHVLRLTSQEWRGIEWRHRLTLMVPSFVEYPGTTLLLVAGGSNNNEKPIDFSNRYTALMIEIANQAGIVVAVLEHVPNQPLLDDLYEDDLIAYTFSKQLETGEADWPLLFPMVKSTIRAMDTVTAFLDDRTGAGPEKFVVTGASKRGWTTWLTAAVDSRVQAIAPIVFDILNFPPQLELQRASFDGYSEQIRAYEERNLLALLDTNAGSALGTSVDPFTYRDQLDMPKLILLGTNDPYWSVDAAGIYFGDLTGPKHLLYAPNSGHAFDPSSMAPTLLAFVRKTVADQELPRLDWSRPAAGQLTATWDEPTGEAWLWTAHSPTRDFNKAKWSRQRLAGTGKVTASLAKPEEGFSGRYIEVRFPAEADSFGLSTEIVVTPAAERRKGFRKK